MSAVYRNPAPLVSPQREASVIAAGIGARLRSVVPCVRNHYWGGDGRISGNVLVQGSPTNQPAAGRLVLLYCEKSRAFVTATRSDNNGAYQFDYLDLSGRFTVIAYDHTGSWRAVIADRLVPQPMP